MRDPAANDLCPRCGYDQRGVIATWRDLCPLRATCTECGLEYLCAEVMQPEKFEPKWCVEYCQGGPQEFLRSCMATFARSLLAWRFWARLQMAHRVRMQRIALYLAVLLVPFAVLHVVAQTTAALYVRGLVFSGLQQQLQTASIIAARPLIETDDDLVARMIADFGEDRVKQIQENELEWKRVLDERRRFYEWQQNWASQRLQNPPGVEGSAVAAVFEAIFLPLARTSSNTIVNPGWGGDTYPSPSELWGIIVETTISRRAVAWVNVDQWTDIVGGAVRFMTFGLLIALLFPLSLAMLPVSRRKAKVRWIHIARITAYGLHIPITAALIVAMIVAFDFLRFWLTGTLGSVEVVLSLIGIGFIPLGTTLWWLFAINRHLKMPHALAVTATLMFVCFLAAIAIVFYASPQQLFGPTV